jgi:hypothetical protein
MIDTPDAVPAGTAPPSLEDAARVGHELSRRGYSAHRLVALAFERVAAQQPDLFGSRNAAEWLAALQDLDEFYDSFGSQLPATIARLLADTRRRFGG